MPRILYPLEYFELLILYLVGLAVYFCNQNLSIYVCMRIGGDGLFNFIVHLGLLLLAGALCPIVGGGSLHIHFIVPL